MPLKKEVFFLSKPGDLDNMKNVFKIYIEIYIVIKHQNLLFSFLLFVLFIYRSIFHLIFST